MGRDGLHAASIHHLGTVDGRLAGKVFLGAGGYEPRSAASVDVAWHKEDSPDFDVMVRAARSDRVN